MLVKIGHFVITTQLSGSPVSYLSQQLGNCLISVKRLFDKFIVSEQCKTLFSRDEPIGAKYYNKGIFIFFSLQSNLKKQIEEMKIQKTKKCGILPFVTKFEVSCEELFFF